MIPATRGIAATETGQLQISLPEQATPFGTAARAAAGRSLGQELIELAHADGIQLVTIHRTDDGGSGTEGPRPDVATAPEPQSSVLVELTDRRDRLQSFCRQHADLLKGLVLAYQYTERWEPHAQHVKVTEATAETLTERLASEEE
ncbi:MAG: hypothetical protein R3B90_15980 [Planctomycetaceae bacterium]